MTNNNANELQFDELEQINGGLKIRASRRTASRAKVDLACNTCFKEPTTSGYKKGDTCPFCGKGTLIEAVG
ncbi:MAG: hypothetical protein K6A23_10830 [Butyrivibrio sp.]|nr:hypothetical protein [Butyrivibrio sp.]